MLTGSLANVRKTCDFSGVGSLHFFAELQEGIRIDAEYIIYHGLLEKVQYGILPVSRNRICGIIELSQPISFARPDEITLESRRACIFTANTVGTRRQPV